MWRAHLLVWDDCPLLESEIPCGRQAIHDPGDRVVADGCLEWATIGLLGTPVRLDLMWTADCPVVLPARYR